MIDELAVLRADDQFFAALEAMFGGDLAPMAALWSHADDVVYMGPSEVFIVGWPAVQAEWERQATMKLGGSIEIMQRRVMLGAELAVVHHQVKGENKDASGNVVENALRGTNVFRNEGGAWKLVAHHSDPLPFLHS